MMLYGDALYFFPQSDRLAATDPGVTPEYAQEASASEPLIVEWTNYSDPSDIRTFRGGRQIRSAARPSTGSKGPPADKQPVVRQPRTSPPADNAYWVDRRRHRAV